MASWLGIKHQVMGNTGGASVPRRFDRRSCRLPRCIHAQLQQALEKGQVLPHFSQQWLELPWYLVDDELLHRYDEPSPGEV
jgi:hypothetical protein